MELRVGRKFMGFGNILCNRDIDVGNMATKNIYKVASKLICIMVSFELNIYIYIYTHTHT